MKQHVYTVLDRAVGAFLQPFFCRAQGEAIRLFTDLVNDGKSGPARYPADYTLMRLGEFDDVSGLFVCADPQRVISALECLGTDRADQASPLGNGGLPPGTGFPNGRPERG